MSDKQQKEIQEKYDEFVDRLHRIVRFPGTPLAEADCELCSSITKLDAFTAFMYPDYSIKFLCNPCGAKEKLRLDYGNKN